MVELRGSTDSHVESGKMICKYTQVLVERYNAEVLKDVSDIWKCAADMIVVIRELSKKVKELEARIDEM